MVTMVSFSVVYICLSLCFLSLSLSLSPPSLLRSCMCALFSCSPLHPDSKTIVTITLIPNIHCSCPIDDMTINDLHVIYCLYFYPMAEKQKRRQKSEKKKSQILGNNHTNYMHLWNMELYAGVLYDILLSYDICMDVCHLWFFFFFFFFAPFFLHR